MKADLTKVTESNRGVVEKILDKTDLNWDVRKEDLIAISSLDGQTLSTNLSGIYRNDNNNYLGSPSKKYTIYQNSELVETIALAGQQYDLDISEGGFLYDGQGVYLQMKLEDEFVGNSQIKRYITAVSSHNGLGSVGFGSTNNIINIDRQGNMSDAMFFRMYRNVDKFRHCSLVQKRVSNAVNQLFYTLTQDNENVLLMKKMADVKVTDEVLRDIIYQCYKVDLNKKLDDLKPREQEKIKKITETIDKEIKKEKGSCWGLFNGVLQNTKYSVPRTKNVKDYTMSGSGFNVNMKAYNSILEFINKK